MKEQLQKIKEDIIRLIKKSTIADWVSAEFTIDFPPFINKGFSGTQIVKDSFGKNIRLIKYDESFYELFFDFVTKFNQQDDYNQIVFNVKRNDYENAVIEVQFNKEVDDKFWAAIPKSQLKEIVPWYKQK